MFRSVALLVALGLPCAASAQTWWDASWSRRIQLTFDNPAASTALTDVPVLVLLDGSRIDYADTLAGGQDLRVIDEDGLTELAFEIEDWSPAGDSPLWVKLPTLDPAAPHGIWLYYGNPSAGPAPASDVWSNGYEAVYHLVDATDATGSWDGVDNGTAATPGPVGPARSFDGSGDYIDTLYAVDLATYTVMGWGRSPAAPVSGGDNDGLGRTPAPRARRTAPPGPPRSASTRTPRTRAA